jgi:hypothetical protein
MAAVFALLFFVVCFMLADRVRNLRDTSFRGRDCSVRGPASLPHKHKGMVARQTGIGGKQRIPMRGCHAIGLVGVGLLIAGFVFLTKDPKLFDQWYEWIVGPFLWMMGCSLMIAWALGCLCHLLSREDKRVANVVLEPPAQDLPGMDKAG